MRDGSLRERQQALKAYVVGIGQVCKYDPAKMKEIRGIVQAGTGAEDKMVALAGWIGRTTAPP